MASVKFFFLSPPSNLWCITPCTYIHWKFVLDCTLSLCCYFWLTKVKVKVTLEQATTAQMRMGSQCHAPGPLQLRERPGTHFTGGWVGPRASLEKCGKSRPPLGFDPRTVQSLYLLNYPGSHSLVMLHHISCELFFFLYTNRYR